MTGPVWMYRNGEARLFASPEEVPDSEGWQDTPVAQTEEPPKRTRKSKEPVVDGDITADRDEGTS